jgi:hypothetical protein
MITLQQYFGGRRDTHGLECSPGIETNAARTVEIVNNLLVNVERFGIVVPVNEGGDFSGSQLNSGWRPPSINSCTAGASPTSLHMTGEAVDLHDPDGELDEFLLTPEGQYLLTDLGLWLESPTKTWGWCHVQTRPPKSGNRVFLP